MAIKILCNLCGSTYASWLDLHRFENSFVVFRSYSVIAILRGQLK